MPSVAMADADPDLLTVALDSWEGPLDLLLALARTQKVDLRAISILELVEQYLAFIASADALKLEVAADYLVMAAWLAYLKSALLLPRDAKETPSPEELALRLTLRLQRLDAMREAGARLMARDRLGRDVFPRGTPEGLRTVRTTHWNASLYDLIAAYGRIDARRRPVLHVVRQRPVVTLEAALARLGEMLDMAMDWTALSRFVPETTGGEASMARSALASSFLAALELAKQGRAELRQDAPFAPLYLRANA